MGCSSEMGCLGPKPRERQVYLDLIEAIYRQVDLLVLPANEDIYEYIKTRLAKKGLLRKLTDNLKSHKSNVYECVNQNFQIISQSNLSQTRVASLIVVDKIMEELLKIHRNSEDSGIERHSLEVPLATTSRPIGQTYRGSMDYLQFDPRIDNIFFKQIIFLLENEKQLEERILYSVIQFCQHKQDKVLNKTEIYILFEYLYRKANKKHQFVIAFKAFSLLLKRLKENLKDEEKDQKYIKCFINLGSKGEAINPQILSNCEQILQSYGSKYFSDYLIMYRSMVQLFDQFLFDSTRIWKIWQLMVKIAKQEDNYNNFVRGIFIYILRYIMVHDQLSSHSKLTYKLDEFSPKTLKNINKEECKLSAFKMVTQWILNKYIDIDETITYSSSLIVMTYITNYVYGTSESIKQELKKQFYRIIELLNVKSNEIIINLLIEEMKERETLNKKRKMLLVVIKEIIVLKKMLINPQNTDYSNLFMIVQPYYSTDVNLQVINYMKFLLKSIKSQYVNGASYDSTSLRQKLCDFVFSIYSCIVSQAAIQQESESYIKTNLFHKSRNLEDLNELRAHVLEKNKYCAELLGIIKVLLQQHFYIIVVSFIEHINDSMLSILDIDNPEQAQILLFFIQLIKRHALFSINKREKLPEEMIKLHLKLQEGYISNAIRNEIIAFTVKLAKECEQDYPQEQSDPGEESSTLRGQIISLSRSDSRRIAAAKEFYMFNQLEYGQVMQCFKLHFRLSSAPSRKEAWQTSSEIKLFHRNSSINLSRQEFEREQESVRIEGDESFRDIITKINER